MKSDLRLVSFLAVVGLLSSFWLIGCSDQESTATSNTDTAAQTGADDGDGTTIGGAGEVPAVTAGQARDFGASPIYPDGPWSEEVVASLDRIVESLTVGTSPSDDLKVLVAAEDPRLAWVVADLLRFVSGGDTFESLVGASQQMLDGAELDPFSPWGDTVDHLMAWDVPVPDQYFEFKRELYGRIEPKWADLFGDGDTISNVDWRHVGWGGVGIDDRPFGSTESCRCIPALDDPPVTSASEGDWYPDDALVFGVEVNGETRAYPKNIMEIHEMVNDGLGGRRIGIPYCTLCGSAQAYFTDELPDDLVEQHGPPVLRTSGLLIRSNKMMYELNSGSFVDTFRGAAVTGPLAESGIVFAQASVVTSTWAEWKAAHPDTTIVAQDGGLGRSYDLDPLNGRDDNGPIFPIGDVDPRLPVQEPILGIRDASGAPIAVHVGAAVKVLTDGGRIIVDGVEIERSGSGIRAAGDNGEVSSHQAFWFAWSQFYPDTKVWPLDYQSG